MINEFKIEKGVEMPPKYRSIEWEFPLGQMEVGDSFLVPLDDSRLANTKEAQKHNTIGVAARYRAKTLGIKITTRRVEGGLRIWRIK